jgi:hypothetical protein
MAPGNDDPIDSLDAADAALRDILLRTRLPPDVRAAIARIIREHTSPALEREGRRQPLPRHDDPQSTTQVDWQNVTVPLNLVWPL